MLPFAVATLTYYWRRSLLLVLCVGLAIFAPLTPYLLVRRAAESLEDRAASTPLILAAKGSKTDVTLSALYFDGRKHSLLTMGDVLAIDKERAQGIPLHLGFSASGIAIVGTTGSYFEHRGLELDAGAFGKRYGDCVVGARVARDLQLKPGDFLTSDPKTIFNLTADYPLRIRVTGVLSAVGSVDDEVVFVSMETAWIMEGLGHGHSRTSTSADDRNSNPSSAEEKDSSREKEKLYLEVTDENIASFHFHGRRSDYPVTACIIVPEDTRAETLLIGDYASRRDDGLMMVEPLVVIRRLLASVLRVRNLVIAGLALVTGACILLVVFVFWLTVRLRQNEFEMLRKIGAAQSQVISMLVWELGLLLAAGVTVGVVFALIAGQFDQMILSWLV